MDKSLETFFRAFTEYKKTTSIDVDSVRFKKSNGISGGKQKEDIVVYFSTCTIDEDWIQVIEKGIPFIQKAIAEERQFIRNDGEVLPIEKIRKTSVNSIQDLAKHSNYITHESDPDAISSVMPDKMLMIQKESDFAVYENRVVYTALVYLRDFVSKRLNAIKELSNKYESKSFYKRKIDFGNRKIEYDFSLHEERLDDQNFVSRNSAKAQIDRLDDILSNILVLLKTPLMMVVSKSDIVKRPITKTNVLKMNRNFREVLSCFDYIADYQGEGFTIQRIEKSCSPFKQQILGDMSEVVMLTSFITYMYGLGLDGDLDKAYQEYLKQEKLNRENELIKKINSIKSKAGMDGKSFEQYVVELEEAYRIIEKRLEVVDEVIRDLKLTHKKEVEDLNKSHEISIKQLNAECNSKIEKLEIECEEKIASLTESYENQIVTLKEEHEKTLQETINSYNEKIANLNNEHVEEINSLRREHQERIASIEQESREKLEAVTTELNNKFDSFKNESDAKINILTEESKKTKGENDELSYTNRAYSAEIIALKTQLKRDSVNPKDFVTKSDFENIEKDREAFLSFFDEAWKEAKKYIRKTHLKIDKKEKDKK